MGEMGRGTLVERNEFSKDYTSNKRRGTFVAGQYDELRLDEDESYEIILARGQHKNRWSSKEQQKVIETIDPFFRYDRHPVPPQFQDPGWIADHKKFDGNTPWAYIPCSAGPDPLRRTWCGPCGMTSPQVKAKTRFVFTLAHLAPYHMTPSKKDPQKTFSRMCLEGLRDRCDGCERDYPTIPAARRFINLPSTDWEVVGETNAELKKLCMCGGKLVTTRLVCSRCGDDLIQRTAENKADFRRARKDGRFYCRKCGISVPVNEYKECTECGNARPRDVFNSVLTVRRAKKETYLQMMVVNHRPAGELLETHQGLLVPMDLEAIFSPMTKDEQAGILAPQYLRAEEMSEGR